MIDIFLIGEIAWCTLLLQARDLRRALLNIGGLLASAYTAGQLTSWFTRIFGTPTEVAEAWLQSHVITTAQTVGLASVTMPAETAALNAGAHVHWIAMHVLYALLFIAITFAVFSLFAVISRLISALWDLPDPPVGRSERFIVRMCALACGTTMAGLTSFALANLAWLNLFQPLAKSAQSSLLMGLLTVLVQKAMHHGAIWK